MLAPVATLAGTKPAVQFVSGTTKAIPGNTSGSLDTAGSTDLVFHYGKSVFTLPYKSITYTEVTEPVGKHLLHVPVPKVGKGARYLNISYSEGGSSRMVTFKASATLVRSLEGTINERRNGPQQAKLTTQPVAQQTVAAAAGSSKGSVKTDGESWWGDKYWRTNRNKNKWPEVPTDSPSTAAGTKF